MRFETRSLGPLGIEITSIDVRDELSENDLAALRRVVLEEGLVLFREQPLDGSAQVELARRFGALEVLSLNSGAFDEKSIVLANVDESGKSLAPDGERMRTLAINDGWHTDSSFREVPASFALLSAVTVPEQGGDTLFASLQKGWDALSSDEQSALYGLDGIHDYLAAYRSRGIDMSDVSGFDLPPRTHPIVRRHPETGRTGLFITEHMNGVEGLPEDESSELLAKLIGVCTQPERIYRHRWSVGDLLIWDNRSTIHRAQGCESRTPRVMHHVRVAGSEPAIAATP